MMDAAVSTETSLDIYHITRCHMQNTLPVLVKMSFDNRNNNVDNSRLYLWFLSMVPLLAFFVIKVPFNIIFPSTQRSSKWYFFRFSD